MTLTEQIKSRDQDWAERFPKRLRRKDKERFLDEIEQALKARNFETRRLSVPYLLQNRLLLTQCENPKIIFTAHYDTPTIMPFWITYFFKIMGHTRQISGGILLVLLLYAPMILSPILANKIPNYDTYVQIFVLLLTITFLTILVPNPNNREDNTSGIIGLMALAEQIKNDPHLRDQVQFIFFDNEEWGLLGSNGLKKYWDKHQYPYREAAVINLDCITRGPIPLIVHHGQDKVANQLLPYIQKHLPETIIFRLPYLPLSDNYTFRDIGAVDISYASPSILPGGYYIPNIHVPADNDFSAERMTPLIEGLVEFIKDTVRKE